MDPCSPSAPCLSLNPAQDQAVRAPIGPVLVLAGPGTGKTRVLTERIRHLVEAGGVPPEQILALTFTNKAAGEMAARLHRALGEDQARLITACTFHRFCIAVLREHYESAGLSRHFSIADEDLRRTLIFRAVPSLHLEEGNITNALHNLTRIRRRVRTELDGALSPGEQILLDAYEAQLEANRLVDFDGLLFITHDLFTRRPDILAGYQDRYRHILVDEFQDTDREQYEIARELAASHRSLFVVADDEQSIYGWRNADPENIRHFMADFKGIGKPIILDRNYRSSSEILGWARELIARNELVYEREVHTQKGGAPVQGVAFDTSLEEARFVASDIQSRIASVSDLTLGDIAVLYPQHAIGAELERAFLAGGLPCRLSQNRGLFDQPVLRRVLTVLRYALDSDDDASLEHFLRRELDADDPALYPAIRAVQDRDILTSFKSAAFKYVQHASPEEGLEVQRALGLAGVVVNAARRDSRASLVGLIDDIVDQLNTSSSASVKVHLGSIRDPLDLPGLPEAVAAARPVYENGGRLFVAFHDEILRHILVGLVGEAIGKPGLSVVEARPGDRLDLRSDAVVLSFDPDPSASSAPFIHLGAVASESGLGPALAGLKFCQALSCSGQPDYLPDYTAFDIETTDLDLGQAEIVEIGAVKVRGGLETDQYREMVRPRGPMSASAEATHGISAAALADAPGFEEVYPRFRSFLGNDLLIAHNGYAFDFQILNAEARRNGLQRIPNPTLDTLPMARSYSPEVRHSIDALCERYGISLSDDRHRALEDARYLHLAFEGLKRERASRYRRMAHERLLDRVALAMLFQEPDGGRTRFAEEDDLHFKLGAQSLLGPANTLCSDLAGRFPRVDADKLRSQARMWLRDEPPLDTLATQAPAQTQRFRDLAARCSADAASLEDAVRSLLDFANLYRPEDDTLTHNAVSLLTLHAAKGLEFREVYICGLEDRILPNARALRSGARAELEEQRRLLYVGMTRAMDRLTLTRARRRLERCLAPSRFWHELGLPPDPEGEIPATSRDLGS